MFKAIKIIGLALIIASFVLLIAFFATMGSGSETLTSTAGEPMHVALLTDTVIYWIYILFGIAIVATISMALFQFIKSLISNPTAALKTLIPIILFAGIFVVSYLLGSGERMSIIGYEGTQNEGVWAQVSDMFIYTIYTLFVLIIVTIFGSRAYMALK